MQRSGLLLLALCALASALPRSKLLQKPEGTVVETPETTTSAISTTTAQPENVITVKNLTELSTKITEAGDKLVVIYIMKSTCPICRWITPTVNKIAETNSNVVVLKVVFNDPATDSSTIVDHYNGFIEIDGKKYIQFPTFVFFKSGKTEIIRRPSSEELRNLVSQKM